MVECAYRGERIREIEEKWIDENVKDEEGRRRRKRHLSFILLELGNRADCTRKAVDGDFCEFHSSEYWKSHEKEIREEFLKLLENDGEKYFVGFHLPAIKFPKVVKGNLHMELTKIHGDLTASTEFKGEARFDGATFQEAWFGRATFQEAWFDGATFQALAWFDGAMFKGASFFINLKFDKWGLIILRSIQFENPRFVSFENTNMDRFLILSTNVEEISLSNVNLPKGLLKAHELLRTSSPVGFTFDDVIETYGRLRGNLERNHRFSDAGVLFVGEMEARRERKYYEMLRRHAYVLSLRERIAFQFKKAGLWLYVNVSSPFALYKYFSKYGESVWRPLAWSAIIILVMPLFFIVFDGQPTCINKLTDEYSNNLKLSFSLFFQMAQVDLKAPMGILLLSILERILGLLFSALEVLALRRMMERHP